MSDDWDNAPVPVEVVTTDTFDSNTTSLSQSIRAMMYSPAEYPTLKRFIPQEQLPQFESIYEIARNNDMTVQQFVQKDPEYALRMAEHVYAEWLNVSTAAALKGALTLSDDTGTMHDYALNKNQTRILELRVRAAKEQLDYVNDCCLTVALEGDKAKDVLERAMYKRALAGDTKLAIYLHDRVDGRPAESKVAELDYDNVANIYLILKTLFDKQLEVLNSGNGTKLVCCSRRAGKTHMLVALLLIECLRKPRTKCMYIGETMELSEGLINKAVNDIIDACNLKDKKGRRLNWRRLDNGSEIMVRGLSNTKDPDQIRGNAAKVIVIDEFFHLKSELLEYMQREVLEPMQLDYADDYMFICAGTPPQVKGTYGEYVWKNWDCDHFQWTWRDNPHPVALEARETYIEGLLQEKGLDWTSSFARREYNGEWAYDDDLLLYPEFHTYDPSEAIPTIKPTRIFFGIDYGVGDNDTIFGCVWNDDEHRGYQFWEDKFNRLDIMDRSISQLEYLCDRVSKAWEAAFDMFGHDLDPKEVNKRILWDADDNDQHLTDYMNINIFREYLDENNQSKKLSLNIENAHKTDKTIMYDRIRDVLRKGDLLVMKGSKLENELVSTILKRGPNGEVYTEVDMKAYHPDLLPAMRYAMYNALGV